MAVREFKLPDPGEGLTEAEIVTWHVAPGDTVKVNDVVVEIETAKSLVELPVPFAGTIGEVLVSEGDTVEVGTPILRVDDGTGDGPAPGPATRPAAADAGPPSGEPAEAEGASPAEVAASGAAAQGARSGEGAASGHAGGAGAQGARSGEGGASGQAGGAEGGAAGSGGPMGGRTAVLVGYGVKQTEARRRPRTRPAPTPAGQESTKASVPVHRSGPESTKASVSVRGEVETGARVRALAKPPVRKLAKDLGVDLGSVTPTGDGGVVTRADVEAAASGAGAAEAPPREVPPAEAAERGETRLPVKGVRKMTAQAMVASAFTAPHVTEWVEVDVTATMELVERLRNDREFRDVKVTPMTVLAKAMCLALRRHPEVNATWDEDAQEIVVKHYVNLGIAAATPRGLVVPNVKDADRMTMVELAGAIAELTATAREGRTPPADMAGGTITITNVGVFGVDGGTPILNPGESAIMAFGSVTRRPWVVGSGGQERIEPRWVTTLALSFDHRLVDGELGSRFLADVAAVLADPSRALVWG